MDPCAAVAESCARVMAAAPDVSVDDAALVALAAELVPAAHGGGSGGATPLTSIATWDEHGWHYSDDARSGGALTAQYVLVLDSLNFAFWPSTTAMEYDTLASCLTRVLRADADAFTPARLAALTPAALAAWFAPHDLPNAAERVRVLHEVAAVLAAQFEGAAINILRAARHSAVAAVRLLTERFPNFRDEAVYRGSHVFLYKRAQICVADMWAAYGQLTHPASDGPAAFSDMDRLTCFADYRIPQLLAHLGAMRYSAALTAAIAERRVLEAGSPWEVQIRAATVVAVTRLRAMVEERLARGSAESGGASASAAIAAAVATASRPRVTAVEIDWLLWQRGEAVKDAIAPHHRVDTLFY